MKQTLLEIDAFGITIDTHLIINLNTGRIMDREFMEANKAQLYAANLAMVYGHQYTIKACKRNGCLDVKKLKEFSFYRKHILNNL